MTKEEVIAKIKLDLAEKGLPLAEDAIEKVVESFEKIVTDYIESSESKMDDMALPIVKVLFELLKKQVDKLDKVEHEAEKK
jgi:hypothetical protein